MVSLSTRINRNAPTTWSRSRGASGGQARGTTFWIGIAITKRIDAHLGMCSFPPLSSSGYATMKLSSSMTAAGPRLSQLVLSALEAVGETTHAIRNTIRRMRSRHASTVGGDSSSSLSDSESDARTKDRGTRK
jgi:hypothetical protein